MLELEITMKEELVSFETAKLAKEKRFGLGENDYIVLPTAYELNGNLYNNGELTGFVGRKYNDSPNHLGADTINDFEANVFIMDNSLDEYVLAPTQALLQKWLREIHNIHIEVLLSENPPYNEFYIRIMNIGKYFTLSHEGIYSKKYEEVLEIGLQEGLKLIK